MSDTAYNTQNPGATYLARPRTDWGAIWGGVFTFAAIFTIFEALALAILPAGATTGFQIWTVVLTIIAMYVAGLETGRLAGITTRHDGLIHGIMMFGLSVVSTLVLSAVVTQAMSVANGSHTTYSLLAGTSTEWATFLALFLGWLAAMGGASAGVANRTIEVRQPVQPPIQMRPAA